jgi:hypothetical protein
MQLDSLLQLRPFLYHLTASQNLGSIRRDAGLRSAASVLRGVGLESQIRTRRQGPLFVELEGEKILIRDQDPLHRGNIDLAPGFTFEDLVALLNARVFFWPGDHKSPNAYGRRHFARYANEQPALLRVPFADLVSANSDSSLQACTFNSGSPRCSGGRKSPRGPETFTLLSEISATASRVVEVVFEHRVSLPPSTTTANGLDERWTPLFGQAAA